MIDEKGLPSGYRGLISKESFPRSESDHPEYMAYLNSPHFGVATGHAMTEWTSLPIMSSTFSACYPVFAVHEGKGQFVHVSTDPFQPTESHNYYKTLRDWKSVGCNVYQFKVFGSTTMGEGKIFDEMGKNFADFSDKTVDSRFNVVVDVQNGLFIVQFMDTHELRRYKI